MLIMSETASGTMGRARLWLRSPPSKNRGLIPLPRSPPLLYHLYNHFPQGLKASIRVTSAVLAIALFALVTYPIDPSNMSFSNQVCTMWLAHRSTMWPCPGAQRRRMGGSYRNFDPIHNHW